LELKRAVNEEAIFYGCLPIPEKKKSRAKIRGTLYTAEELKNKFQYQNFDFNALPYENGALLYFTAKLYDK
jgi:hypothetical protein